MFNFLKDKIKSALSKFKKDVKEEVEEEVVEEPKEEVVEEKKEEVTEEEPVEEAPEEKEPEPVEEEKAEEVVEEKEEEPEHEEEEKPSEEVKEPEEEAPEEPVEEEKKEEKVPEEKEKPEEVIEEPTPEPKKEEEVKEEPEEEEPPKEEVVEKKEAAAEEPTPEKPEEEPEPKEDERVVEEAAPEERKDVNDEIDKLLSEQQQKAEEDKFKKKKELDISKQKGTLKEIVGKEEKPKEEVVEEAQEKEKVEEEPIIEEAPPEEPKGLKKIFGLFKKKEAPVEEEVKKEEIKEEEPKKEAPEIKEKKPIVEEEPKKKSFTEKLKEVIIKKQLSDEKFEELFWELELALMENNVAVSVIEKIKGDLRTDLKSEKVSRFGVDKVVKDGLKNSINSLFDVEQIDILEKIKEKKPYVVAFVGINGVGKTTALAKLAHLLKNQGLEVIIAAADTFRVAAIEQLEHHANKLGIKMIKHEYGSDSAAVAFDAIAHAKAKNKDVVLIDTAGRSHANANLMDELRKVINVNKPDLTIFVGDSLTGNDAVEQAQEFDAAVGVDGIILTKVDADEKGGAAISISHVTQKPILYIGTGQGYDDLQPFDKDVIINNMGLD